MGMQMRQWESGHEGIIGGREVANEAVGGWMWGRETESKIIF